MNMFGPTICLLLLFAVCMGDGNDRHMICKQVEDIFARQDSTGSLTPAEGYQQGRPGRMGPQGPKGLRGSPGAVGAPGPAAIVDYDRVNAAIDARMETAFAALEKKIQVLNATMAKKMSDKCDVQYEGKCYWTIIHKPRISFAKAEEICAEHSGFPASFYTEQQYNVLMGYIRPKIPRSYTQLWTGMKVDPQNRTVSLRSGVAAPFLDWFPGYPYFRTSSTNMYIQVAKSQRSTSQGMRDFYPTYNCWGVLCEA